MVMQRWQLSALALGGVLLTGAALIGYRDVAAQLLLAGFALCGFPV